jgi:hypothetical protein
MRRQPENRWIRLAIQPRQDACNAAGVLDAYAITFSRPSLSASCVPG